MKPYISCSLTPAAKKALLWVFRFTLIGAIGYFLFTPSDQRDDQVNQLNVVEETLHVSCPCSSPPATATPKPTPKPTPPLEDVQRLERFWDRL